MSFLFSKIKILETIIFQNAIGNSQIVFSQPSVCIDRKPEKPHKYYHVFLGSGARKLVDMPSKCLTALHNCIVQYICMCGKYILICTERKQKKKKKNSESLHVIEGVSAEEAPFHDYFCGYLLSFLPHLFDFFLSLRLVLESESYSAVAQSLQITELKSY